MPVLDCTSPCTLSEIKAGNPDKGGVRWAYWGLRSAIESITFDVDGQITAYSMVLNEYFYRLIFDRENTSYIGTYSEEAGLYEHNFTVMFDGKSVEQRNAISNALDCNNLVFHIGTANCKERVIGIERDSADNIERYTRPMKIGEHEDRQGQSGGDRAGDMVVFTGKSDKAALFSTVGASDIPVEA